MDESADSAPDDDHWRWRHLEFLKARDSVGALKFLDGLPTPESPKDEVEFLSEVLCSRSDLFILGLPEPLGEQNIASMIREVDRLKLLASESERWIVELAYKGLLRTALELGPVERLQEIVRSTLEYFGPPAAMSTPDDNMKEFRDGFLIYLTLAQCAIGAPDAAHQTFAQVRPEMWIRDRFLVCMLEGYECGVPEFLREGEPSS